MIKRVTLFIRLLLAFTFFASFASKLSRFRDFESSLEKSVSNIRIRRFTAYGVPVWELVLALLQLSRARRASVISSIATLSIFSIFLVRKSLIDDKSPCNCFGPLMQDRSLLSGLIRNLLLILAAVMSVPKYMAFTIRAVSAFQTLRRFDAVVLALSVSSAIVSVLSLRELGLLVKQQTTQSPVLSPIRGSDISGVLLLNETSSEVEIGTILDEDRENMFTFVSSSCSACKSYLENRESQGLSGSDNSNLIFIGDAASAKSFFTNYDVDHYYSHDSPVLSNSVSVDFLPSSFYADSKGTVISDWLLAAND